MLVKLCEELLQECRELDALVSKLGEADWERVTPFFDWTIRDQIMHLHQVDSFGLTSLEDGDRFKAEVVEIRKLQAADVPLSEQARRAWGSLSAAELLALWRTTYETLVARFLAADAKTRIAWFGPDMSLASFASARQMEVWAHGQDIYDLLGETREPQDRIRNICDLGVRTFGWSFRNRGMDVPVRPAVELVAPSGAAWTWDGEADGGTVRGSALDFALIVTQRRAPEDTAIVAEGESAQRWLPIAQCFAGAPQTPAAPGSRPSIAG